ncbi:MAG: hypothetical protein ACK50J_14365 [Planctomyces sp.]
MSSERIGVTGVAINLRVMSCVRFRMVASSVAVTPGITAPSTVVLD